MPVVAGAMLLVLAGCGGQRGGDGDGAEAAQEPTTCAVESDARLSIATGNTTGVYYSLGGAYAEAISKASGGKLKATAAETSASLQNIQQLVAGTHQVAFSLADTAADAAEGKESFDEPQPIAALARLYPNYTQVIARSNAGINSIADMRGKRVSTGAPNSGTEVIANRMLAGGRPRPGQRHPGAAHRTRQDGRGHERRLDRRDVLVGRPADERHHRPLHQPARQRQVARRDGHPGQAEGDQPHLRARRDPGRDLPDAGATCRRWWCPICFW